MDKNKTPSVFSTKDKRTLQEYFDSADRAEGTYSFFELIGFLVALASSPVMIMPSDWLPIILNSEEDAFEKMADAETVMPALMNLYNDIQRQFQANQVSLPEGFEKDADQFLPESGTTGFCRGFASGYLEFIEEFEEMIPKEMLDNIEACCFVMLFFISKRNAESCYGEMTEPTSSFEEQVEWMRNKFPDALESYVHELTYFQEIYGKAVREASVKRDQADTD